MLKFKQLMLFICTFAILLIGIFLPDIVSFALNQHLSNRTEQLEINNVSFDANNDNNIIKRLTAFDAAVQKEHSEVKVESENLWHNNMDKKEIKSIVLKIIDTLGIYKSHIKIQPMLLANSNDKSEIAPEVFWYCEWDTKGGESQYLWIDDQTGKMLKMKVFIGLSYSEFQDFLPKLNEFCTKYYETKTFLDLETSNNAYYDDITISSYSSSNCNTTELCMNDQKEDNIMDSSPFDYSIDYNTITLFGENKDEKYVICVYIKDGMMYFNV